MEINPLGYFDPLEYFDDYPKTSPPPIFPKQYLNSGDEEEQEQQQQDFGPKIDEFEEKEFYIAKPKIDYSLSMSMEEFKIKKVNEIGSKLVEILKDNSQESFFEYSKFIELYIEYTGIRYESDEFKNEEIEEILNSKICEIEIFEFFLINVMFYGEIFQSICKLINVATNNWNDYNEEFQDSIKKIFTNLICGDPSENYNKFKVFYLHKKYIIWVKKNFGIVKRGDINFNSFYLFQIWFFSVVIKNIFYVEIKKKDFVVYEITAGNYFVKNGKPKKSKSVKPTSVIKEVKNFYKLENYIVPKFVLLNNFYCLIINESGFGTSGLNTLYDRTIQFDTFDILNKISIKENGMNKNLKTEKYHTISYPRKKWISNIKMLRKKKIPTDKKEKRF